MYLFAALGFKSDDRACVLACCFNLIFTDFTFRNGRLISKRFIEFYNEIVFEENKVNLLILENKEKFVEFIQEIIKQIDGEYGKFSLFEENTELKITDKIDIIKDIFDLNLNNKKVLNKIYHELEKLSVDAEFLLETKNMENSLLKYIYYLIENYDYPLEIIEEIDLKEIFKLFSVKLSLCFSNKIEDFVDLLEDKINYPEKIKFKDRCDFSNLRSEFEKFVKIFCQVLAYLTIFALICIVIPIILILTYQFLIYLITLVTTIGKVIVATIYYN